MPMHGVIFDMDGVLVDSTQAHFEAFKGFADRHGFSFTHEFFNRIFGLHNRAIFPLWLGQDTPTELVDRYAQEKEALYRDLAPQHVKPLEGVIPLINKLHEAGFLLAVGSSGPRENVEVALKILEKAGAPRSRFLTTVSGDDTSKGKPDPSIFLKAAQDLSIQPSQCVVIEDAIAGIQAAHAAGMKVIAVSSSTAREKLTSAHLVVDSLTALTPDTLKQLLYSEQA